MPVSAAAEALPGALPLTVEYALKSPGYAISHDWSSDSRRVAIDFLQGSTLIERSTIYALDVESRRLAGPLAGPSEHVAMSPDGKRLAATAARVVRLYATEHFELLARAEAPVPDCYFAGGSAFSADGTFLWIRCSRLHGSGAEEPTARAVAFRYQLPNLELADRITVIEPVKTTSQHRGSVRIVHEQPILMGVVRRWDKRGGHRVDCFNLNDKLPCFKGFQLLHRPNIRHVLQLSTSVSLAVVSSDRIGDDGASLASHVDIYETASGNLVTTTVVPAPMTDAIPEGLEFISGDRYVIAAFSASKKSEGGLAVWNLQSGEVVQSILRGPVRRMSASPDGHKILVVTKEEILMYGVAR